VSLHVAVSGAGPDLVLLHGWGMNGAVWDEAAAMLAMRMRVHAVDLPGHGLSTHVPVGTLDEAADAIAERIPRGAAVCGWSLGGLLAQRIARRHPAHARLLALVGATPRFVAGEDWDHGMRADTLEEFARDLERDLEQTLATFVKLNALHGARGRQAIREFTARLASRPPPTPEALERGLAWLRETDLRIDAPWVATPALVMHGARDGLVPVAAGRWLAQSLPHASLVEWPDAAHLPFFTHREAFVAALESFVG
jgi:pimeloyl-[acyl-carrier protein] methyl ester esterase